MWVRDRKAWVLDVARTPVRDMLSTPALIT